MFWDRGDSAARGRIDYVGAGTSFKTLRIQLKGDTKMSEVAVSKKMSELQHSGRPWESSLPALPLGRLFNTSPFTMMREFANEMDRVFQGNGPAAGSQAWAPSVDVQQCNGNLMVSAELPGLKKEDVNVEVNDDVLLIQGERKQEHKEDHEGYHLWEPTQKRQRDGLASSKGDGAQTFCRVPELRSRGGHN
jgi:hypothetical protein